MISRPDNKKSLLSKLWNKDQMENYKRGESMKLKCSECRTEIKNISIVKTLTFRSDFKNIDGVFTEKKCEREYIGDNFVQKLIYDCECFPAGVESRALFNRDIQDFIRDSQFINPDDLKNKSYGNLIVEK